MRRAPCSGGTGKSIYKEVDIKFEQVPPLLDTQASSTFWKFFTILHRFLWPGFQL
jgi:hypothetical protein